MATKPQIPHLHCALPSSMPHNPTLPAISNPPFSASLSQAHHQIDALPRRAPSLFEPTATRTEQKKKDKKENRENNKKEIQVNREMK
ncbi:hypothetical protein M0R45_019217 [Rubus argutus]|uniref:Uncharacterized protein n=1 Tax=Rubus argutus TaxID=59490 RepID=A0AAW1X7I6_RUBAR